MKHRILKRRHDGYHQRYWVGRKRRYGFLINKKKILPTDEEEERLFNLAKEELDKGLPEGADKETYDHFFNPDYVWPKKRIKRHLGVDLTGNWDTDWDNLSKAIGPIVEKERRKQEQKKEERRLWQEKRAREAAERTQEEQTQEEQIEEAQREKKRQALEARIRKDILARKAKYEQMEQELT
jgi:hypothetical protein